MTVAEVARLRVFAADLGVEAEQLARLNKARHPAALAFYLELRRSLAAEYVERRPFSLPATILARRKFMPGRRDRKWYLRMTGELLGLGLIVRIEPAANGRPAQYIFMRRRRNSSSKGTPLGR